MLMYGKEASNRKQEIDRQHHTIPNQRPKDKQCGNVHNRLWNHGQLENNVAASGFEIPADVLNEIEKILDFQIFERHVG